MRHAHWRQKRNTPRILGGGREDVRRLMGDYVVSSFAMDEDDGSRRFIIWGDNSLKCVDVITQPDGESVLNLEYKNMARGDGTKAMLNFAFKFLKSLGVRSVHITDTSKTTCRQLGPMYFLKHGMTWYEKTFGFVPSPRHAEDVRIIKESRLRTLDIPALESKPCEEFTDDFIADQLGLLARGTRFHLVEWVKYL